MGIWNIERSANEELGALHRQAMVETDPVARDRLYRRMQDLMEASGALVFLTHEVDDAISRDPLAPALLPDGGVVLPESGRADIWPPAGARVRRSSIGVARDQRVLTSPAGGAKG